MNLNSPRELLAFPEFHPFGKNWPTHPISFFGIFSHISYGAPIWQLSQWVNVSLGNVALAPLGAPLVAKTIKRISKCPESDAQELDTNN